VVRVSEIVKRRVKKVRSVSRQGLSKIFKKKIT